MNSVSANEFLAAAIDLLDYSGSPALIPATNSPSQVSRETWGEFGEWLAQGHDAGVERIFFVKGNPVVVFSKTESESQEQVQRAADRIWCMARPTLLFLASTGSLRVYNLTDRPAQHLGEFDSDKRLLETIRTTAEVASKLHRFRRSEVESGRVFEDPKFDQRFRADYSLIRDLGIIRKQLLDSLSGEAQVVNDLIGKVIFVRYLEDREIIDHRYYMEIAKGTPAWGSIVEKHWSKPSLPYNPKAILPRVLEDKAFTFAVFDRLSRDFNGDVFPKNPHEREVVNDSHLNALSKFLLGESEGDTLFFKIYQFDVIPIELISCIYEEFYKTDLFETNELDQNGTHYTPTSLVEFLLHSTLRKIDFSGTLPRIIDPACGSGIFLVAAFRRLVRETWAETKKCPTSAQLVELLGKHISGIDINESAIVIAAFSLYLTLLHYQVPKAITDQMAIGQVLPNLIAKGKPTNDRNLNILHVGDAFNVVRAIPSKSFDVVIGNPPWGIRGTTLATKEWVSSNNRAMSRGERSQAFVWLSLHLLKPNGRAGLLLAKSVLLSHDQKNTAFRQQWLDESSLVEVADFTHVRQVFFSGPDRKAQAIHPFICVVFQCGVKRRNRFLYLSAKSLSQ